ncbi:NMDA receptor-regulated protein 1-domain-containing protein, partial [Fimicolochytrium jonesii]|uniref:NMDA receptor-regulated protein 1-domain-containing protein n=1 Tax=Fimicolochytrium jonesii TaxID=1396493 RepID=UPI0022FEFBFF
MPPAPVKQGRELPSKESATFKAILKLYEHKQYKRGLKMADQILKKFPEHGETQAMKGLFLSHLNRKEEGYEFVKKGLRNDLTSHTCWHVYGLMHRADKNYDEAIKCYLNALKFDKENIQIIRDLSLLQMQMRNYEGYNETRHQLLSLRPANRMYWVGLAISYHMLQKYDTALNVLSAFEETLNEQPEQVVDYENSEMLMYKNFIIEESGDNDKALAHLAEIRSKVVDKRGWKEAKARLLLKSGKLPQAEVEYRQLLDLNADCHAYLDGLLEARQLGTAVEKMDNIQIEKAQRLMKELGAKYPKSHVIQRTPLKLVKGDAFRQLLDAYLRPLIRKGVPSLFVSLKDLYVDAEKADIVEQLVLDYEKNLKSHDSFDAAAKSKSDTEAVKEPPTAYLWVVYFLAQHYDWKRDSLKALELIETALKHTPTLVELLMTKARILKHGGDVQAAMEAMNQARELDLQDRFINSKCTKYMLRNDQVEKAGQTISLFTRSESTDPLGDLVDMQCMWFALESASSHVRTGKYGPALKRLHQIDQHFSDIYDDQFDFHSYALRKMTLRAYVDLLHVEDRLRGHPSFYQAATTAVQVYLQLIDKPKNANGSNDAAGEGLSEAERKKAERKARKAALKTAAKAGDSAQPAQQKDSATPDAAASKDAAKDKDPDGAKYLAATDYLAEAEAFVKHLLAMSPSKVDAQILGVEVYSRKGKFLLALKALKHAYAL